MGKHFSAMVISVHRIMYQEYYYIVGILLRKYIFTLLRVHTAEGLVTNEMLKNLGSEVLTRSAAEARFYQ